MTVPCPNHSPTYAAGEQPKILKQSTINPSFASQPLSHLLSRRTAQDPERRIDPPGRFEKGLPLASVQRHASLGSCLAVFSSICTPSYFYLPTSGDKDAQIPPRLRRQLNTSLLSLFAHPSGLISPRPGSNSLATMYQRTARLADFSFPQKQTLLMDYWSHTRKHRRQREPRNLKSGSFAQPRGRDGQKEEIRQLECCVFLCTYSSERSARISLMPLPPLASVQRQDSLSPALRYCWGFADYPSVCHHQTLAKDSQTMPPHLVVSVDKLNTRTPVGLCISLV